MSSTIFTQAKQIRRKAVKARLEYRDELDINHPELSDSEKRELAITRYENVLNNEIIEFKEVLKISQALSEAFREVHIDNLMNNKQYYFITVRPRPEITFDKFYHLVKRFTERKCIEEYTLSFEQKGTIEQNNIGFGFHVHICAKTTHRSKGECLRDCKSTFMCLCAENCIKVEPTKNPQTIIDNYLVEYKSEDGHKEITKTSDSLWRQQMGLAHLYRQDDPLPLKVFSDVGSCTSPSIKFGEGLMVKFN